MVVPEQLYQMNFHELRVEVGIEQVGKIRAGVAPPAVGHIHQTDPDGGQAASMSGIQVQEFVKFASPNW